MGKTARMHSSLSKQHSIICTRRLDLSELPQSRFLHGLVAMVEACETQMLKAYLRRALCLPARRCAHQLVTPFAASDLGLAGAFPDPVCRAFSVLPEGSEGQQMEVTLQHQGLASRTAAVAVSTPQVMTIISLCTMLTCDANDSPTMHSSTRSNMRHSSTPEIPAKHVPMHCRILLCCHNISPPPSSLSTPAIQCLAALLGVAL